MIMVAEAETGFYIWGFTGLFLQIQAKGVVRCLGSGDGWMEFSFSAEPGRAPGQDTPGPCVKETVSSGRGREAGLTPHPRRSVKEACQPRSGGNFPRRLRGTREPKRSLA